MKIVIDANMVIAALIKDSKAREVITSDEFNFISPDFILQEIKKYKDAIKKKAKLDDKGFEIVMSLLFEHISIIPKEDYQKNIEKAKKVMIEDVKDAPYVACFLSLKCTGIWTNDPHFKNKNIKLFSTKELLMMTS